MCLTLENRAAWLGTARSTFPAGAPWGPGSPERVPRPPGSHTMLWCGPSERAARRHLERVRPKSFMSPKKGRMRWQSPSAGAPEEAAWICQLCQVTEVSAVCFFFPT